MRMLAETDDQKVSWWPMSGSADHSDTLELGLAPRIGSPRSRRLTLLVLALVVVVGSAMAVVRQWPGPLIYRPADLADVYASMVRSDGSNMASPIVLDQLNTQTPPVDPACLPLFDTTQYAMAAPGGLDGVGTYWTTDPGAISMFTWRYPDTRAARLGFDRVQRALTGPTRCAQFEAAGGVVVPDPIALTPESRAGELAYGYLIGDGAFTVVLLQYANTVTWEFRYSPAGAGADPADAVRLMHGLWLQLTAVGDRLPR